MALSVRSNLERKVCHQEQPKSGDMAVRVLVLVKAQKLFIVTCHYKKKQLQESLLKKTLIIHPYKRNKDICHRLALIAPNSTPLVLLR